MLNQAPEADEQEASFLSYHSPPVSELVQTVWRISAGIHVPTPHSFNLQPGHYTDFAKSRRQSHNKTQIVLYGTF
jgi:hypothetical protein